MHHHRRMGGRGREHRNLGERGASLVEYALLVGLIAVVCIAAVTFLGTSSSGKFGAAGNAMKDAQYTCIQRTWTIWEIVDSDGQRVELGAGDCSNARDEFPQYFD